MEEVVKISLSSDFKQFYDHLFYPAQDTAVVWQRNTRGTMNRKDMFQYLMNGGFKTPINGVVKDVVPVIIRVAKSQVGMDDPKIELATNLTSDTIQKATKSSEEQQFETLIKLEQEKQLQELSRVVVYTDEYAHRGAGKVLVSASEAVAKYPDHYCSQYIPTRPDGGSASERVLSIGQTNFRIEFASDEWRSNCGDSSFAITHRFVATPVFLVNSPIFAIDYIRHGNEFIAIDFNESPDVDLIKKYMSDVEIYAIVEEFITKRQESVQ